MDTNIREPLLVVLNEETAECILCDMKLFRGDGIILQVCGHTFCKKCLRNAINHSGEFQVPCPLVLVDDDCAGYILLSEIHGVLPADQYAVYLETSGRFGSGSGAGESHSPHVPVVQSVVSPSRPSTSRARIETANNIGTSASLNVGWDSRSASGHNNHQVFRSEIDINILLTTDNGYCGFCADFVPATKGIMLKKCLHAFCKDCLRSAILSSDGGLIPCPMFECGQFLCESEIKTLVSSTVYEEYARKGFRLATKSLPSFHCRTKGCSGVCVLDLPDLNRNQAKIFLCPVCNKQNCMECAAIHEDLPCAKWKSLRAETDKSITDEVLLERSEDVGYKQIRKTMQGFLTGLPEDNLALYYDAAERVMENIPVLPTQEEFECLICSRMNSEVAAGGIVLQQCSHAFCRECLEEVVKGAEQIPVACPYNDAQNGACDQFLTPAEFKALATTEVFEKHVRWGWKIAEDIIQRKFTCLEKNCEGFWEILDDAPAGTYICPLCESTNCVKCNVIHNDMTCDDYQEKLRLEAEKVKDDANRVVQQKNEKVSAAEVERLITTRNYMRCPFCGFVCEKISGCAHVKCLNRVCKRDFNWYT